MTRSMIVTGAARGIGEAVARAAANEGYRVGVLDIDADGANAVAESLPDAVALVAATNDEAQVAAALDSFGATPDVLVNNAGIVRFGPLLELSVEEWCAVVDVNINGTYICSRAVAPGMIERGSGVIVNVSSINGIAAGPNSGAYSATKSAIAMMTEQMAIEWGPSGVRVNTVAPGLIDGGMSEPIYADPEFRALRTERVPLRRLGASEEVADAVLFLASERASYITGHELVVDGGVVRSIIASLPRPKSVDSVGSD